MAIQGIDHYTILTNDLAATRHFYCDLLGLTEGARPPFDFPGAWLYVNGHPTVHVVAGRPIPGRTTGGLDHIAFQANGDIDELARKLEGEGIAVSTRKVPGSRVWQLFCNDPSGVKVEFNYPPKS
ncbi:MAG: VOC family protein [Proteobacteria bacterium]|nr:VOC family protein [Pseudomonadota bacterium]